MVFKFLKGVSKKGSQKGLKKLSGVGDQARSDIARGLSKISKSDTEALYKAQSKIRGLAAEAKMQVKAFRKKNPNNPHVKTVYRIKPEIEQRDKGKSTIAPTTTTKLPTKTTTSKTRKKKTTATTKTVTKKEIDDLAKTGTPTKAVYNLGKTEGKATAKQKAAMKKFAEFKPTSRVGTADYDREINKASAELARAMGKTSATGKKYTRKKRRTRRTKKKADGKQRTREMETPSTT